MAGQFLGPHKLGAPPPPAYRPPQGMSQLGGTVAGGGTATPYWQQFGKGLKPEQFPTNQRARQYGMGPGSRSSPSAGGQAPWQQQQPMGMGGGGLGQLGMGGMSPMAPGGFCMSPSTSTLEQALGLPQQQQGQSNFGQQAAMGQNVLGQQVGTPPPPRSAPWTPRRAVSGLPVGRAVVGGGPPPDRGYEFYQGVGASPGIAPRLYGPRVKSAQKMNNLGG